MRPRRPNALPALLAVALSALPALAWAQGIPGLGQPGQAGEPTEATKQAEAPPAPAAIAPAQVPNRAEAATTVLRQANDVAEPLGPDQAISPMLPDMAERIARMQANPTLGEPAGMDFRSLEGARQRWQAVRSTLENWQQRLTARSESLAKWRQVAADAMETWRLTVRELEKSGVSGALAETARGVLSSWQQADERLKRRQGEVLTSQSELTAQVQTVEEMIDRITREMSVSRADIFQADYVPLWRGMGPRKRDRALPSIAERVDADTHATIEYIRGQDETLIAHVLFTLIVFGVLLGARKRLRRLAEEREEIRAPLAIFQRPVPATLALALMANFWLYPDAPPAFREAVALVAMIPLVWLLPLVVAPSLRRPVYVVLALFLAVRLTDLLSSGTGIGRLVLLGYAAAAGAVAWWVFRPGGRAAGVQGGRYWNTARLLGRVAALLFIASAILNVLGFVTLADLLAEATLRSAVLGLWLFLVVAVLHALFAAMLFSALVQKLNMARWNQGLILKWIVGTLGVVAALTWLLGMLRYFRILEPAWSGVKAVLTASASIGSVSISLGDILAFVVALLVGVYLARLLRFVLTVEVFPRVTLPRGVPATIVMLANYTVLGIAFVFAVAAAGIDLSNFAIIAGALSVGIGFGLQNVVNNFVSGLILAFERPIQAGDAIQMADMWGRVSRIGVRSSTVRTWSGAEVIVPNGDLISNQVTNWTLSDQQRRLEIPAGVAYGTNPHQVIELLIGCAKAHPKVLSSSQPQALFLGFGASSLDFELRCWTDDFDNFLSIKSELTLAIHDALYDAGIEIPFPQRDLHLRSVDEGVAARLAGRSPPAAQLPGAEGGDPDSPDAGGDGSPSGS